MFYYGVLRCFVVFCGCFAGVLRVFCGIWELVITNEAMDTNR